jgi:diguanylate cyclase (GGDEF)-like protein
MRALPNRRNLKRTARKCAWGLAVFPYLAALYLVSRKTPSGIPFLLPASVGFLAAAGFLVAYLVSLRKTDLVPNPVPAVLWGGGAAMEIHVLLPEVASSMIVPGALCFTLGLKCPLSLSVPGVTAVCLWLAAVPGPIGKNLLPLSMTALLAGAAGAAMRNGYFGRRMHGDGGTERIGRSGSPVLSWEEENTGVRAAQAPATENSSLARREREWKDGVRQALERILPLTGAAHVAYTAGSGFPGIGAGEGMLVSRDSPSPREITLPDMYVPVREATVFRKTFYEVGPSAAQYTPWAQGERKPPTGIASVPVLREGVVEGVILAIREEDGPWREPVLPVLEFAGHFLAREIDRTRELYGKDREILREDWYHRMVRNMAEAGSEWGENPLPDLRSRRGKVYAETAEQVRLRLDAERVLLVESGEDPGTGRIACQATSRGTVEGGEEHLPLGDSYVGWVIRNETQRIFRCPPLPPRNRGVLPGPWEKPEERSFLVLPAGGGGFHGAIVCAHSGERRFEKRHAEVVKDILRIMQLGLSHVERLESLAKKASTDGLTGLWNRKTFLDRLAEDLSRLDGRYPCAVVMLDIDHFKSINDTYGHPFGDEVLRSVAAVLKKGVRKGDTAGRYGGEEFVLYLHMADTEKACEGAERFRRMIRRIRVRSGDREVSFTASFGVACAPHHGKGAEELLRHADEALYLSKQRGRDRVTLYPGPSPAVR